MEINETPEPNPTDTAHLTENEEIDADFAAAYQAKLSQEADEEADRAVQAAQARIDASLWACPACGLPTSRWDDANTPPAGWYCDGPNDSTDQQGCFTLTPDKADA